MQNDRHSRPNYLVDAWRALEPAEFAALCAALPPPDVTEWLKTIRCNVKPSALGGASAYLVVKKVLSSTKKRIASAKVVTEPVVAQLVDSLGDHHLHPTLDELQNATDDALADSSPGAVRLVLALAVADGWTARNEAESILLTDDRLALPNWSSARNAFSYQPTPGEIDDREGSGNGTEPEDVPTDVGNDAEEDQTRAPIARAEEAFKRAHDANARVNGALAQGRPPDSGDLETVAAATTAFAEASTAVADSLASLGGDAAGFESLQDLRAAREQIERLRASRDATTRLAEAIERLAGPPSLHVDLDKVKAAAAGDVDDTLRDGLRALVDLVLTAERGDLDAVTVAMERGLTSLPPELHRLVAAAISKQLSFARAGGDTPAPDVSMGDERDMREREGDPAHETAEHGIVASGAVEVPQPGSEMAAIEVARAQAPAPSGELPEAASQEENARTPAHGERTETAAASTGTAEQSVVQGDRRAAYSGIPGRAEQSLVAAASDGRFALAHWLAEALELPDVERKAFAIAALAQGTWTATGQQASRAAAMLSSLDAEALEQSHTARVLAAISAARVAVVAPLTGATRVLRDFTTLFSFDPDTDALLEATLRVAESGLSITSLDLAPPNDETAEEYAGRATRFLDEGQQRNTPYQLASAVWRSWLRRDGALGRLLDPVRRDDRTLVKRVSAAATELQDDRVIERLIDTTSADLRPQKKTKIIPPARTVLFERVVEAASLAQDWAAAVTRARVQRAPQEVMLRELRAALDRDKLEIAASMHASLPVEGGPRATAAVRGAASLVATLAATARNGVLPSERSADDLLLEPVYWAFEITITGNEPERPLPLEPLIAVADGRPWEEAFAGRCELGDFDVADKLLAVIDDDTAYEEHAQRAAERLSAEQVALEHLAEKCRIDLDTAHRQGLVDDDTHALMYQTVTRPLERDRKDLRSVRLELETVQADLEAVRRAALALAREELDTSTLSVEAREAIEALLDAEEIATARAYVDLAHRDVPLPRREPPAIRLEDFYPAVVDGLEHVTLNRTVLQDVQSEGTLGPISWGDLRTGARDVRDAVAAWLNLRSDLGGTGHLVEDIRKVLAVLGIDQVANVKPDDVKPSRVQPRRWVSFTGRHNDHALTPQFGSELNGHYDALLCWGAASEANVREWVSERDGAGGVLVLYFGLASMAFRRHLAELSRRPAPGNRPMVLIDDAVFLFCSTLPRPSYEVVMRLGLPFAHVNPYQPFRAGLVPPEMFYGRRREISQLLRREGASIVYGGRQLGKSALLRAVERAMGITGDRRALFVDLAGHDITSQTTELFWHLIDDGLNLAEIPVGKAGSAKGAVRVTRRIRAWLDDNPQRELLLLVDEVDRFLNADAEAESDPFRNTWRLKALRDETGGRFKPILTGLHQAARFGATSNSPFTHLETLVVGPLVPQEAFDLVDKPFAALGYAIDEAAVNRILAYTHFNPGLIQMLCRELVDAVANRPRQARSVPFPVTTDDVEAVHAKVDLAKRLRDRFMATLHLDHRYLVIAMALARESDEAGRPILLPTPEITRLCESYWPEGFVDVSHYEFRSLMAELVDLGVLREKGTEYGIAGPHVRLMLGSSTEVEMTLMQTSDLHPPREASSAAARSALKDSRAHRLPLTDAQLHAATRTGTLCVVVGSDALGVTSVARGLAEYGDAHSRFRTRDVGELASFAEALTTSASREEPYVVTLEVPHGSDDDIETILYLWDSTTDRGGIAPVVIVSADAARGWRKAVACDGRVDLVVLERWRPAGLHRALAEVRDSPASPAQLARICHATGGWPILVEPLLHRALDLDLDAAIDATIEELTSQRFATAFVGRLALGADARLDPAFDALVEYGSEGLDPDELAVLVDVPNAGEVADMLRLLGVAAVTSEGKLVAERVAADAWAVAHKA